MTKCEEKRRMGRRKRGRKGKEEGGVKGGRKWMRRGESNFRLIAPFLLFTAHTHTNAQAQSL